MADQLAPPRGQSPRTSDGWEQQEQVFLVGWVAGRSRAGLVVVMMIDDDDSDDNGVDNCDDDDNDNDYNIDSAGYVINVSYQQSLKSQTCQSISANSAQYLASLL